MIDRVRRPYSGRCEGASWVVGRGDLVEVGVGGGEGGDCLHVFAGGGVGEHVLEVVRLRHSA